MVCRFGILMRVRAGNVVVLVGCSARVGVARGGVGGGFAVFLQVEIRIKERLCSQRQAFVERCESSNRPQVRAPCHHGGSNRRVQRKFFP